MLGVEVGNADAVGFAGCLEFFELSPGGLEVGVRFGVEGGVD